MKNKYKILVICVAIFLFAFLFNTTNVLAYKNTYTAWRYDVDGDGKPDLLFRRATVITDNSVIEEYINERSNHYIYIDEETDTKYQYTYKDGENTYEYSSKWVYVEPKGIYKPQETEFSTVGYTFHKSNPSYTNISTVETGNIIKGVTKISTTNVTLLNSFTSDKIFTCTPEDVIAKKEVETTKIHEIVGVNMAYNSISLGTGINVSNIKPKDKMVYRYAIINNKQTDLENGINFYIEDRIIYHEQLKELRNKLIDNGITNNQIYISDIVISEAMYDEGGYELAYTLPQFFNQYKKEGYSNKFWPKEVLGLEEPPTSSILNVFGNTLSLPAKSDKSVIVRHINLKTETTVSKENIQKGSRIESTDKVLFIKDNPEDTEWKSVTPGSETKVYLGASVGYIYGEEIYNTGIEVYQDIKKSALQSEDGSYACIGYNVAIGDSWYQALNGINAQIQSGNMTEGDTVNIDGLVEESEDEYIIIDFYYTEPKEENDPNIVYVNHLFVDEKNEIKKVKEQTIIANSLAYTGLLYTKPLSSIKVGQYNLLEGNWRVASKVQERYYRKPGQKILVQTALTQLTERLGGGVEYKGYEIFGSYTPFEELEGYKINAKKDWYRPFDTILGAVLPANSQQINFYYYKVDPKLTAEPSKTLLKSLELRLTAKKNSTECQGKCIEKNDSGEEEIQSVPSGTNVEIEITDLARNMVSAIHVEYISPAVNTHEVDVNLEYICGKDSVKVKINNVKYSFGHFRVTDLVLDSLQKIVIYDANEKWSGTSGTSIFGWKNDKKEINVGSDPFVGLYSRDSSKDSSGKYTETGLYATIGLNSGAVNDWKNYVAIYVTDTEYTPGQALNDKYIHTTGDTSTTMIRTFLTQTEFDYIDADKNGIIDAADKEYAKNRLGKLEADKNLAGELMKSASENLDEVIDEKNEALAELTYAENELTRKNKEEVEPAQQAYNAAVKVLNKKFEELNNARTTLNDLKEEKTSLENTNSALLTEISNLSNWATKKEEYDGLYSCFKAHESWGNCDTDYNNAYNDYNNCSESGCTDSCYSDCEVECNCGQECDDACESVADQEACMDSCNRTYDNCLANCSANETQCKNSCDEECDCGDAPQYTCGPQPICSYDGIEEVLEELRTIEGGFEEIPENVAAANNKSDKLQAKYDKNEERLAVLPYLINGAYNDIHDLLSVYIPEVADKIMLKEQALIAAKKAYDDYKANEFKQAEIADAEAQKKLDAFTERYNKAVAQYNVAKEAYDDYAAYYNGIFVITEESATSLDEIKAMFTSLVPAGKTLFEKATEYYNRFWAIKEKEPIFKTPINIFNKDDKIKFAELAKLELVIMVYNTVVAVNGHILNVEDIDKTTENNGTVEIVRDAYSVKYTDLLENIIGTPPTIVAPDIKFKSQTYNKIFNNVTTSDDNDITSEILNGIRTLAVEATYTTKSFIINTENHRLVEDNVYYSQYIDNQPKDNDGNKVNGIFRLDRDGLLASKTKKVNIYTPITASATLKSNKNTIVDQSKEAISNQTNIQAIQLSVPFTIKLENNVKEKVYDKVTNDFCKGYYIKFNFDVHNVKLNGNLYQNGARVKAGTWIGLIDKKTSGDTTVEATPYSNVQDVTIDIADEEISSYVVRAVAYNATKSMMSEATKYTTILDMMDYRNSINQMVANICTNVSTTSEAKNRPSYFADTTYSVVLLNRLYDFRITDIKDIAWKSVFRKTQGSTVNAHTGIAYYTGTYKWVLGNEGSNKTTERTPSEIGSSPQRILPVGAYKNTDKTYIKAPKLGYGFSFDLKLTGNYYKGSDINKEKYVSIKTKFYYVSKSGSGLLSEYIPGSDKKGIYLFYKNAAGKYVRIDENGGGYELSFVPNDGYRLIEDKERITLSKNKLSLGNLRDLKLTYQMATVAQTYSTTLATDNGNVITYYGEYKLPNSTIAVEVDATGKYDINKPLKNGYIGVIFDITAMSGKVTTENGVEQQITLSYSQNSKYDETTEKYLPNTSQWDYEGYLGFKDVGKVLSKSSMIKLEGGNWTISSNITYNAIKGTVILYDIDEKAATDYE